MPKGFKTGGRTKGTPNKKTAALQEQIEKALGGDLPSEVIKRILAMDPERAVAPLLDLMSYIYPKRKAVEHSTSLSPEEIERLEELKNLPDEELEAIVKEQ